MREYVWARDGKLHVIDSRTLAKAIAEAVDRIEAEYAAQIAAGMTYSGKPLQIDEISQGRIVSMVTRAKSKAGLPPDFAWIMGDNSELPLAAAGMEDLGIAASTRVMVLRAALQAAKKAARAAKTREEADAIKAVWPE